MKNQTYRMALLYDFYGDDAHRPAEGVLTTSTTTRICHWPRSRRTSGITRQGVRDVIVRAEASHDRAGG